MELAASKRFCHTDQVASSLVSPKLNNFCFFEKMENSEVCAMIKQLNLKGSRTKEIKTELYAVRDESAPG